MASKPMLYSYSDQSRKGKVMMADCIFPKWLQQYFPSCTLFQNFAPFHQEVASTAPPLASTWDFMTVLMNSCNRSDTQGFQG